MMKYNLKLGDKKLCVHENTNEIRWRKETAGNGFIQEGVIARNSTQTDELQRLFQWLGGHEKPAAEWTDEKNERRCDLIDKEINDGLTFSEEIELDNLQELMLHYRRKVAPRPIEEARRVSLCRIGSQGGRP